MLEHSRGNLGSWKKALLGLGLVLRGRNLPAGDTFGRQIAALRKRRELGQRALARMVGVTQPTVIRLESEGSGRLDTLESVLTVLGALLLVYRAFR